MTLRKSNRTIVSRAATAAAVASILVAAGNGSAFAQSPNSPAAPRQDSASMLKRPQATSDGTNPDNPDNMPIMRPRKPTNEKMMRTPPASAANAN